MKLTNIKPPEKKTFVITSTDDTFKSTPYFDADFEITVRELTRAESMDIIAKSSDGESLRVGTMNKALFAASIADWKGIEGEDGKIIECTRENKEAVWEYEQTFSSLIEKAIDNHLRVKNETKKAVKKK